MGDDDQEENSAAPQVERSPRQTAWFGQLAFSAIATGAHLSKLSDGGGSLSSSTSYDKWTASAMIISMGLACLAWLAHHFSAAADRFVGKLPEGVFATLILALWAAALPAIMDPDRDQAVDSFGEIQNANLYFSSWAALAVAVYIFGNYVTQTYLKDRDISMDPGPMTKWYMLTAASVVVMSSSSRLFQSNDCSNLSDAYCTRTKYAISTGAVGTTFGLAACLMGSRGLLKKYPEAALAAILFCMYVIAIAFLTFGGDKAPADNIGNLYFSTWIGFVISVVLASACFHDVKARWKASSEDEAEASDKKEQEAEEGEADKKPEEAQPPEAPVKVSGEEEQS